MNDKELLEENESNDIIIENIDTFKKKWNKKVIISLIINLSIIVLTVVATLINDMIFETFGRLFIRESNINYTDTAYCKMIGGIVCIIIYVLALVLQAGLIIINKVFYISNKDILYFATIEDKNSEYKKLYKDEKKHVFENVSSKIYNILNNIMDYYRVVLIAILTVILLFTFVLFPAEVNQSSMENTLYDGNRVVIFSRHKASRGDIVVFKYSNDYQRINNSLDGDLLIKRVIAKEGDTFECVNGNVYVNGELVVEDYVSLDNKTSASYTLNDVVNKNRNYEEILGLMNGDNVIPKGYYLVLGDNRIISNDSEEFGLVYYKQLSGVVKYYKDDFGWNKIA